MGMQYIQSQNIKFVKKYSFPGMNGGLGSCRTSDGGLVITGQHEGGHCKVYIAKINKCGALQWYKIYDFGHSAGGIGIIETFDGGIVIAGAADLTNSGYDWLVMKVDANGNYLWHDLWRNGPNLHYGTEWAQALAELPNHNIVVVGGNYMWYNENGNANDGIVTFYDSSGGYLFTKRLAGNNYDMFSSVAQNGNYIYIMGSTYSFGSGGRDIVVVKTDLNGNPLWIKTYGTNINEGGNNDTFHKIYPTSDGGALIASRIEGSSGHPLLAGSNTQNTLLLKIDMNGNLQWARSYDFGGWDNYAMSISVSPSNKIRLGGISWGFGSLGGRDAYIAILDQFGVPIQVNMYGFNGDDSFIETLNYTGNRILLVGNTQQPGTGHDPFIVVADSMGACQGCSQWFTTGVVYKTITSSFQVSNVSIINYWKNHVIVPYQQAPIVSNVSPSDDFVCASCSAIAPTFTVNRTNLCVGDSLKITNTTSTNDACLEWFINGSPINPQKNDTTLVYNTPGTYTLSMQTTCGNTVLVTTQTVQVWPQFSITATTNSVSCYGGTNGSATVNISGGMPPYSYLWTPSAQTGSILTDVPMGPYTVTVNDAGACGTTFTTVTIPQPISPPGLTILQTHSITCFGSNDGSVVVNSYGGTAPLSYSWTPGGMTSSTVTNLGPGIYTVEVIDANNCVASQTVNIDQPPPLSLSINSGSVSCNGGNDGWVSGTAMGGSGAYTYTWLPINSNNSFVNNLSVGHYTLVVKDLNNCFLSDTISITQPPAMTISATSFSSNCYGIPTGSGTVTVSGGVGGYQYQWLPIGGTNSVATNLPGGQYTINVLDANNCPISTTLMINQPSSITLIPTPNATICYGTSTIVGVNVSGGTPPYTYFWNDGLIGPGPHTVSPLSTNFYNVYVNDNNNCVSETKTIKITVLPSITVVSSSISVCDKDTTIVGMNAYGGTGGPYNYLWNTGSTTNTISIIGDISQNPMTYTLNVSDGCTNPDGVGVFTVYVNPLPILSFVANPISGCVPLKVTFNAINGTSFDDYYWDFGNNQNGYINPVQVIYDVVDTFDVKLKMTTMFGCTKDTIVTSLITTYSVPIASFYPDPPVVSELNGEIHFVNTSIGGVSYFWNFGDPYSTNNTDFSMNTVHLYTQPNTYTVSLVVTNSFGCSDTTQSIVTIRPDVSIYIPNTFTPNDDGINDVFKPLGVGIQGYNYKMEIFDRWGEKIFETTNFNEGWDGTYKGQKVKEGIYAYIIVLYDIKGYKHFYSGHVTLLSHQ